MFLRTQASMLSQNQHLSPRISTAIDECFTEFLLPAGFILFHTIRVFGAIIIFTVQGVRNNCWHHMMDTRTCRNLSKLGETIVLLVCLHCIFCTKSIFRYFGELLETVAQRINQSFLRVRATTLPLLRKESTENKHACSYNNLFQYDTAKKYLRVDVGHYITEIYLNNYRMSERYCTKPKAGCNMRQK